MLTVSTCWSHQALLQIELMTGATVPAAVLYQAGHAALATA